MDQRSPRFTAASLCKATSPAAPGPQSRWRPQGPRGCTGVSGCGRRRCRQPGPCPSPAPPCPWSCPCAALPLLGRDVARASVAHPPRRLQAPDAFGFNAVGGFQPVRSPSPLSDTSSCHSSCQDRQWQERNPPVLLVMFPESRDPTHLISGIPQQTIACTGIPPPCVSGRRKHPKARPFFENHFARGQFLRPAYPMIRFAIETSQSNLCRQSFHPADLEG